ncbi:MAG TPA: hypothetical protein VGM77_09465 [Gemmatimonadales bacterium]
MVLRSGFRLVMVAMVALVAAPRQATAQVTVGGVGYLQYAYSLKADSALVPSTGSAGNLNNFDVARAYVNILGKFSNGVQTRITTDVDGRKAATNQLTIRLKYAFVGWTPDKSALTFKTGLFTTPWIDYEEALYGYRMQGTTLYDRNGFFPSSDFGIGADGTWKGDAVNMQVGVFDGEGYSNAPGDAGKDAEGRVSVRLAKTDLGNKVGGLRLTGFAQVGSATGGSTRTRFIGMLSYKSKQLTLASEYGIRQDSTGAKTPSQKGMAFGAYGILNLPHSKAALLLRYDIFDPNTDSTSAAGATLGNASFDKQSRIIAGVSYAISPNLRVMLDLDLNSLQYGSTNAFDVANKNLYFHTEFTF